MANIVDVDNEPGNLNELEKSLKEAVTASEAKPTPKQEDKPAGSENDDPLKGSKFEGKDIADILDSYKNLESAYGRMANDLGTQRKLTDRLLDLKRDEDLSRNAPGTSEITLDSAELLDNPTQALDRYIAARDARTQQQQEERFKSLESQLVQDRFLQKHPDFQTVAQDADFLAWAQASPVRSRVAQAAAGGDWTAADDLLTEYKEGKKATAPAAKPNEELEAARKAGFESSAPGGGSNSSGKVYRRADLIDLKINKPHVYQDPSFQAEILKAYSEGRVK